ncbi:MAG: hypothetical protein IJ067_04935 [Prevotella sp.]|nr:hypothetical protein [Prevotella sp.]
MIDPKFTEQIARWLDSEHTTREQIEAGAQLLLSLNRDHAMFQRIMHRPERMLSFLEYKLRRFLQIRKDGQTIRDVIQLDNEITPHLQAIINSEPIPVEGGAELLPVEQPAEQDGGNEMYVRKGIRPDHDQLPADIQAIWPANAERWKKIKEAYETCKSLTEPCDRYEYLKVLKETWYKYKQEMARYDDYQLTADGGSDGEDAADQTPALTPEQEKELGNADSYISKNLPQMQQLVAAAKEEDFNEAQKKQLESLRGRIQQRVDVLLKYGRTLTDERREQLLQCDIKVTPETPEENEQGHESE